MSRISRASEALIGLGVLGEHYLHRPVARVARSSSRGPATSRPLAPPTIAQELSRFEVVSFDLFDTLITRVLAAPNDVHDVVALRAAQAGIRVESWRSMREAAEGQARRAKGMADVTLADIYAALAPLLPADDLDLLRGLEVEVEVEAMVPTARGRVLYEQAQRAARTIVIASDMYLPKDVLERCLHKCGYEGWDLLIASGEDGVSKYEGTTFRLLQQRFGGRVAHVGDHRDHDVRNARRAGIRAFHLPAPAVHHLSARRYPFIRRTATADVREHVADALTIGLGIREADRRQGRWTAFQEAGYCVLGPLLLSYVTNLQGAAGELGATRLHFLAREGRILRRAYEAAVAPADRLPSTYALLSSRVTSMAALGPEPTTEALRFIFKTPVRLPARAYLSRFLGAASTPAVDAALRAHGIDPSRLMDEREALPALTPAVRDLWPRLHEHSLEQRGLLLQYLEAIGLTGEGGRPLIVDVGWAGTIQRALEQVTGLQLHGYYVCLVDDERTRSTPRLHAWIDARRGGREAQDADAALEGLRVLEVLMAAPDEGSVGSFREPSPDQSVPAADRLGLEFPPAVARRIDECQDAALRFIEDYRREWRALGLPEGDPVGVPGRDALMRLLARPTRRQLDDFARLPFDGSYGERPGTIGPWGASALVLKKVAPSRLRRGFKQRVLPRFGL